MNIKCLIGLHDYEQLKCKTLDELKRECFKEYLKIKYHGRSFIVDVYETKICLRCGKFVDEITPIKENIINKLKNNSMRRIKAKEILNIIKKRSK